MIVAHKKVSKVKLFLPVIDREQGEGIDVIKLQRMAEVGRG